MRKLLVESLKKNNVETLNIAQFLLILSTWSRVSTVMCSFVRSEKFIPRSVHE